ncbi:hypothetical protein ACWEPN_31510 [Nonomuraea wenchangensis]
MRPLAPLEHSSYTVALHGQVHASAALSIAAARHVSLTLLQWWS